MFTILGNLRGACSHRAHTLPYPTPDGKVQTNLSLRQANRKMWINRATWQKCMAVLSFVIDILLIVSAIGLGLCGVQLKEWMIPTLILAFVSNILITYAAYKKNANVELMPFKRKNSDSNEVNDLDMPAQPQSYHSTDNSGSSDDDMPEPHLRPEGSGNRLDGSDEEDDELVDGCRTISKGVEKSLSFTRVTSSPKKRQFDVRNF